MRFSIALTSVLLLSCAAPLAAQSVKLEFKNGKVDLAAQNATVRAILQEWGKQGGTKIINGERIPGAPVTIELSGAYEREALEILLRGVAGYVVGPREAGTSGASGFDRIMILPTSNAPRPPATGQAFTSPQAPQTIRPPVNTDEDDELSEIGAQPQSARPGVNINPRLQPPGVRSRVGQLLQQPQGGTQAPGPRERLQQIIEEDFGDDDEQQDARPAPAPQNPFNVAPGSNRPGVIAPVPPPQQRQEQER